MNKVPIVLWASAPHYAPDWPRPQARYLPGEGIHPRHRSDTVPPPPLPSPFDPSHWQQCMPYLYGIDLYHEGYNWEAHEAWEEVWLGLSEDDPNRKLLQGLIFLTASVLKVRGGNLRGARRHSGRALERFQGLPELERVWGLHRRDLEKTTQAYYGVLQQSETVSSDVYQAFPRLELKMTT